MAAFHNSSLFTNTRGPFSQVKVFKHHSLNFYCESQQLCIFSATRERRLPTVTESVMNHHTCSMKRLIESSRWVNHIEVYYQVCSSINNQNVPKNAKPNISIEHNHLLTIPQLLVPSEAELAIISCCWRKPLFTKICQHFLWESQLSLSWCCQFAHTHACQLSEDNLCFPDQMRRVIDSWSSLYLAN